MWGQRNPENDLALPRHTEKVDEKKLHLRDLNIDVSDQGPGLSLQGEKRWLLLCTQTTTDPDPDQILEKGVKVDLALRNEDEVDQIPEDEGLDLIQENDEKVDQTRETDISLWSIIMTGVDNEADPTHVKGGEDDPIPSQEREVDHHRVDDEEVIRNLENVTDLVRIRETEQLL